MTLHGRCLVKGTSIIKIVRVTLDHFFKLTGEIYAPYNRHALAFARHRMGAAARGIGFDMTFPEWWAVWQESGRYGQRAVGGYVMARHGDTGPYKVGNVYICSNSSNVRDGIKFKRARAAQTFIESKANK